jgi:uncharacterized protein HemY
MAHTGLGEFEKARPYFELIQRDQRDQHAISLRSSAYMGQGRHARAAQMALMGAYARDPGQVQAGYARGRPGRS